MLTSILYYFCFLYGVLGWHSNKMNPISACTINFYDHNQILSHCTNVFRRIGIGHSERVYHNALIIELERAKIPYRSEVMCPILYDGFMIGYGTADLILHDVVVELKAKSCKPDSATSQLKKYLYSLKSTKKKSYMGIIINFNQYTGKLDYVFMNSNSTKLT